MLHPIVVLWLTQAKRRVRQRQAESAAAMAETRRKRERYAEQAKEEALKLISSAPAVSPVRSQSKEQREKQREKQRRRLMKERLEKERFDREEGMRLLAWARGELRRKLVCESRLMSQMLGHSRSLHCTLKEFANGLKMNSVDCSMQESVGDPCSPPLAAAAPRRFSLAP